MSEIASSRHGLILTSELLALGVAKNTITAWVAAGRLHRRHRGVFAIGHDGRSQEQDWMAAVLATGPEALLSHLSAAKLSGFWRRAVPRIDVVTSRRRRSFDAVGVHQSRSLLGRDGRHRHGIPLTAPARLFLDLGDVLDRFQLANVMHEAEFRRCYRQSSVDDVIRRNRGRAAVTTVHGALALREMGSEGTDSDLEDEFLALVLEAMLVEPRVNVPVHHGGEVVKPDFRWDHVMLVVEVDGSGHLRRRTQEDDRFRDRVLGSAGYEVIRVVPERYTETIARIAPIVGRRTR